MSSNTNREGDNGSIVTPTIPGVFYRPREYPHPDDRHSVSSYCVQDGESQNSNGPKTTPCRTIFAGLLLIGLCIIVAIIVAVTTILTQPQGNNNNIQRTAAIQPLNMETNPPTGNTEPVLEKKPEKLRPENLIEKLRKEICNVMRDLFVFDEGFSKAGLRNCSVALAKRFDSSGNLYINMILKPDQALFEKQAGELERELIKNVKGKVDVNDDTIHTTSVKPLPPTTDMGNKISFATPLHKINELGTSVSIATTTESYKSHGQDYQPPSHSSTVDTNRMLNLSPSLSLKHSFDSDRTLSHINKELEPILPSSSISNIRESQILLDKGLLHSSISETRNSISVKSSGFPVDRTLHLRPSRVYLRHRFNTVIKEQPKDETAHVQLLATAADILKSETTASLTTDFISSELDFNESTSTIRPIVDDHTTNKITIAPSLNVHPSVENEPRFVSSEFVTKVHQNYSDTTQNSFHVTSSLLALEHAMARSQKEDQAAMDNIFIQNKLHSESELQPSIVLDTTTRLSVNESYLAPSADPLSLSDVKSYILMDNSEIRSSENKTGVYLQPSINSDVIKMIQSSMSFRETEITTFSQAPSVNGTHGSDFSKNATSAVADDVTDKQKPHLLMTQLLTFPMDPELSDRPLQIDQHITQTVKPQQIKSTYSPVLYPMHSKSLTQTNDTETTYVPKPQPSSPPIEYDQSSTLTPMATVTGLATEDYTKQLNETSADVAHTIDISNTVAPSSEIKNIMPTPVFSSSEIESHAMSKESSINSSNFIHNLTDVSSLDPDTKPSIISRFEKLMANSSAGSSSSLYSTLDHGNINDSSKSYGSDKDDGKTSANFKSTTTPAMELRTALHENVILHPSTIEPSFTVTEMSTSETLLDRSFITTALADDNSGTKIDTKSLYIKSNKIASVERLSTPAPSLTTDISKISPVLMDKLNMTVPNPPVNIGINSTTWTENANDTMDDVNKSMIRNVTIGASTIDPGLNFTSEYPIASTTVKDLNSQHLNTSGSASIMIGLSPDTVDAVENAIKSNMGDLLIKDNITKGRSVMYTLNENITKNETESTSPMSYTKPLMLKGERKNNTRNLSQTKESSDISENANSVMVDLDKALNISMEVLMSNATQNGTLESTTVSTYVNETNAEFLDPNYSIENKTSRDIGDVLMVNTTHNENEETNATQNLLKAFMTNVTHANKTNRLETDNASDVALNNTVSSTLLPEPNLSNSSNNDNNNNVSSNTTKDNDEIDGFHIEFNGEKMLSAFDLSSANNVTGNASADYVNGVEILSNVSDANDDHNFANSSLRTSTRAPKPSSETALGVINSAIKSNNSFEEKSTTDSIQSIQGNDTTKTPMAKSNNNTQEDLSITTTIKSSLDLHEMDTATETVITSGNSTNMNSTDGDKITPPNPAFPEQAKNITSTVLPKHNNLEDNQKGMGTTVKSIYNLERKIEAINSTIEHLTKSSQSMSTPPSERLPSNRSSTVTNTSLRIAKTTESVTRPLPSDQSVNTSTALDLDNTSPATSSSPTFKSTSSAAPTAHPSTPQPISSTPQSLKTITIQTQPSSTASPALFSTNPHSPAQTTSSSPLPLTTTVVKSTTLTTTTLSQTTPASTTIATVNKVSMHSPNKTVTSSSLSSLSETLSTESSLKADANTTTKAEQNNLNSSISTTTPPLSTMETRNIRYDENKNNSKPDVPGKTTPKQDITTKLSNNLNELNTGRSDIVTMNTNGVAFTTGNDVVSTTTTKELNTERSDSVSMDTNGVAMTAKDALLSTTTTSKLFTERSNVVSMDTVDVAMTTKDALLSTTTSELLTERSDGVTMDTNGVSMTTKDALLSTTTSKVFTERSDVVSMDTNGVAMTTKDALLSTTTTSDLNAERSDGVSMDTNGVSMTTKDVLLSTTTTSELTTEKSADVSMDTNGVAMTTKDGVVSTTTTETTTYNSNAGSFTLYPGGAFMNTAEPNTDAGIGFMPLHSRIPGMPPIMLSPNKPNTNDNSASSSPNAIDARDIITTTQKIVTPKALSQWLKNIPDKRNDFNF